MMLDTPKPTDEQTHILDLASRTNDNLMINALAGTGKASTLEMVERAIRTKPVLYLVFNKKNAKEAEKRMLSTTTVRTVNGIGHRVWSRGRNCVLVDPRDGNKKSKNILVEMIKASPKQAQEEMWNSYWAVIQGVAMAKAVGYIPEGAHPQAKRLCTQGEFHATLEEQPDDLTSDLIDAVLLQSIKQAYGGAIDYNDQVYMPAVFGGTFPQFPLIAGDEVQDWSPVNHAMVDKLVGKDRRFIGVGDPWQNIYAFRGAKQQGMASLASRFSTVSCDLSISFRCPRAVVEAARWRVPHFKWLKEGGHVEALSKLHGPSVGDEATFICRNNAPLFKLAMQLISSGRSVQVAGSDIGPKLVDIMRRLGDESLNRSGTLAAIDAWLAEKLSKESSTAEDLAACMRVFANLGNSLGQAIGYAEHLFAQQGKIQLLTGHKAKGLEFPTVYHLDPWLCREDEQDLNLRYVITTRSADTLYEVDSNAIEW